MAKPYKSIRFITEPTRVTETTDTLIDHVYTTHPENIVRCFTSSLSLSDHFPICFTRKVNSKLLKDKHTTTSYRSYKHFDEMKLAKVLPIYKGGEKSDPSNYRPISILSTLSKIFEKHVNKHLMAYLNKYKLLHDNQSGFRPKHSCQTALVKLINDWMKCIDKGDLVGALFINFGRLLI